MEDTIRSNAPRRLAFIQDTAFRTRRRKAFSRSHPFGAVALRRASRIDHAFSIGFRSGELVVVVGGSCALYTYGGVRRFRWRTVEGRSPRAEEIDVLTMDKTMQ